MKYKALTITLVVLTLGHAEDHFKTCYEIASKHYMSTSSAAEDCVHAGPQFDHCFHVYTHHYPRKSDAVHACSRAKAGFEDCYEVIKDNDWWWSIGQKIDLCIKANKNFKSCYKDSQSSHWLDKDSIHNCIID